MWVCMRTAQDTQARVFLNLADVQTWLDELPLELLETCAVWRLGQSNRVPVRAAKLYVREKEAH